MKNTRTVLLETNIEVVLWSYTGKILFNMSNSYFLNQYKERYAEFYSDVTLEDVRRWGHIVGERTLSSIYDHHYFNTWDICQLQKQ